jgi:Alternative complex III, ActD subunit
MKMLPLHGVMAEFESPEDLMRAARAAHDAGYRKMDAYSPAPIEGLVELVGAPKKKLPTIVFCGGAIGALGGYYLQYWISVVSYPLNIGGRPYHSWVAFIPVTFELTILCAAFSSIIGMLVLNGLPQPYHPVFHSPDFKRASRDRFFLCIEGSDPQFDAAGVRSFFEALNPCEVTDLER